MSIFKYWLLMSQYAHSFISTLHLRSEHETETNLIFSLHNVSLWPHLYKFSIYLCVYHNDAAMHIASISCTDCFNTVRCHTKHIILCVIASAVYTLTR